MMNTFLYHPPVFLVSSLFFTDKVELLEINGHYWACNFNMVCYLLYGTRSNYHTSEYNWDNDRAHRLKVQLF